jgi:hypothetical protein
MSDKAEKTERRQRVEHELETRRKLAVPALVGGVLYMMSAVTITAALSGAPTVGLLQGLAPAVRGEKSPAESPRTPELRYIANHATALIVGSLMEALAVVALTLVLLFLWSATKYRKSAMWPAMRPLILFGGIAVAVVSLGHQIVSAVLTHNFIASTNHTNAAVEKTLTTGPAIEAVDYIDLLGGLALAIGMVTLMVNALRVGLLARWMAMLGMFAGVLIFLPIGGAQLQVVPALWLVFAGILFFGRWPGGDPPAWKAGEAIPWPPGGRARQQQERQGRAGRSKPSQQPVPAPEPQTVPAVQAGTSRKRRKRR